MDKFLAQATIHMTITRECNSRGEAESIISKMLDESHNDFIADGMKVVFGESGIKSYKQILPTEGELCVTLGCNIKEIK